VCVCVFTAIPEVNMSCNGRALKACFHSRSDIVMSPQQFHVYPNCSTARFYQAEDETGNVCLELDMSLCAALSHSSSKVCCCLPAHQLCGEQVLFLAASVCLCVCLFSENLENPWSEIDVTW